MFDVVCKVLAYYAGMRAMGPKPEWLGHSENLFAVCGRPINGGRHVAVIETQVCVNAESSPSARKSALAWTKHNLNAEAIQTMLGEASPIIVVQYRYHDGRERCCSKQQRSARRHDE